MTASTLTIDLSGKRALVTGAGQGVGAELARTLAAAGASVVVNDLRSDRAASVVEGIRGAGGHAEARSFDVTDAAEVESALSDGIDILVNNAGNSGSESFRMQPFASTTPDDWEPFLRVNLYGVMYCTRAALPHMIASGWGRVITIVSDAGRLGEANMAAYSAAKAGAAGFLRSIAAEVGRHGVTANAVALGTMRTPVAGADLEETDPDRVRALLRGYAIRRRGEPQDVAGLVALLASPMASWITGQTIPVNGGHSMAL